MNQLILIISGPTATGKSTFSLELSRKLKNMGYITEIISMDSALVYHGMDIGTSKPKETELLEIQHHNINVCYPNEHYSVMRFYQSTHQHIRNIQKRNHIPIIVGGTMFYLHTLIHGLSNLPSSNSLVRSILENEARIHGWPALHKKLAIIDPISASKIKENDSQRIQRALEVYKISGKPISFWHSEHRKKVENIDKQNQFKWLLVFFIPRNRNILHNMIENRFYQMLNNGFIEEVEILKKNLSFYPEQLTMLPAMKIVGYKQILEYLDEKITYSNMQEKVISLTRQLAKKQLTWMRCIENKECFDPFSSKSLKEAYQFCLSSLIK